MFSRLLGINQSHFENIIGVLTPIWSRFLGIFLDYLRFSPKNLKKGKRG